MNFTTIDTCALYLNKVAADLTPLQVAQLNMLITQIDGVIQSYCGWDIFAKDYTKTLNGNGLTSIDLGPFPLLSVTSATLDTNNILSIVKPTDDNGYLFTTDQSTFTRGTNNLIVSFRAGFEVIPNELDYAAAYLVTADYKKISNDMIGVAKGKVDAVEVQFESSDIPKRVQDVLDQYMMVVVR